MTDYTQYEVDNYNWNNMMKKMTFVSGIQNARNILEDLEKSMEKSSKYEKRLAKCKGNHCHLNSVRSDVWEKGNGSDDKDSRVSKDLSEKSSRSLVNLAESWSTMSIVCLQYQYEELSKRYESLLQAYDERCSAVSKRDASLQRMREDTNTTQEQIAHAHHTLLAVGDKYLALRNKHYNYKSKYENKIARLQEALGRVAGVAERAREELDTELTRHLTTESDAKRASLLAEIRRCNRLIIENMKLKKEVESCTRL